MHALTKLYIQKMSRQKLIYIFFVCFFIASLSYAFLISSPEMEQMLNIDIEIVGRENFPEFMMRFYVGTVGILFQVFLFNLYICDEDRTKMLYQPLLHGENRIRIIKSKVFVAAIVSIIFVILVALINYIAAFMRWGYRIFEVQAFMRIAGKYLLSCLYMSCVTLGIVAASICTRSAWKNIFITIIYIILDTVICNTNIVLKKIWIGYYPNLWLFSYEYRKIPIKAAFWGIIVMIVYGVFFYQLARYKIKRIDF